MKAVLREQFRARRREFQTRQGRDAAPVVNANLRRLLGDLDDSSRAQVCAYSATPEEMPVDLDAAWFLPRITIEGLRFHRPHPGAALATNRFGIAEPRPDHASPWFSNLPTVVVCPAVAVDWRGGRLGLGKSYYDRFFTDHPGCVRIGVVYHVQVAKDPLPADGWDQPLDWIVTEKMILRSPNRSL